MNENKYLRWLSASTPSIYWHDSADIGELNEAISNGAVGVTTNPFLIHSTLRAMPNYWSQQGVTIDESPDGDERAESLTRQVTSVIADKVAPFRELGYGSGYFCAQLNPNKPGESTWMQQQAARYDWASNLVIKIPATRAGIVVLEALVACGCNVAATVSFTVSQVLSVGEAFKRGAARARANEIQPGLGIAVLMVGRLDDYLRDVLHDSNGIATESDIRWAGIAAIKRAYEIFEERRYECILMPAGCRGSYHITELAGATMIMSIAPKIAAQLALLEEPFEKRISLPVDQAILERLMDMSEFRKAYEADGMEEEDFITFGPVNRTLSQFCDSGWNPLQSFNF